MEGKAKFIKKWLLPISLSLFIGLVLLNACRDQLKIGMSKAPGVPTDLVAEVKLNDNLNTGDVMISWKPPTYAGAKDDGTPATITGYQVEYTSAADFSDADNVETVGVSEAKDTLKNLEALGTTWKVRVFAKNASKKPISIASQILEVKIGEENSSKATFPAPATQVAFTALSDTSIIANFTPSTDGGLKTDGTTKANIIGYKLIVSDREDVSSVVAENTVEEPAASSISVTGLTAATTYYATLITLSDNDDPNKREAPSQMENSQVTTKGVGSQETAAATPPTPTVGTVSYKSLSVTVPAYAGTSPQFGYAPDGATERTGDYTLELYNPATDSWSDTGKDIASDQATTATLEQLTPGTAYKVRVKAYPKEGGNDVRTNLQTTSAEVDASTKQVTTPGAPQNAQATPVSGEKSVTLSWNAPADDGGQAITGYEVYWSESGGVTSATGTAVTVSGTSTSVTVENLPKGGTTYYFAIYAVNASGKGDKVEVSATVGSQETAAATPPTPTVVASYESLSVTVPAYAGTSPQFGYAPDGATERTGDYTLELYNPTTDSWSDTGKDIASDQATTATLEQLTPGTAYKVRVKAYPKEGGNDVGTNLQTTSAEVDASTKQVTTPGAPQNAQATPVSGEKSVTLSWNAPADDGGQAITGYEVYWSESNGVTSATGTAVTVSGTSTSVTVENLPKGGTTYYFAIYAVNDSGKGDKVEVSATVGSQETAAATPPTPTVVASYESLSVTVPAYAGTSPQFGYAPDGATERTGDYTLELYNPTTDSWSDTGKDIASDQATTATLEQLTPGTAYKVRVKAYPKEGGNDVGTNLQTTSAEVDASTKQVTTPGAPQNAQATSVSGKNDIALSWNAPADDGGQAITGYEVYWSESSGVTSATGTAVTVSGTSTSVTVENLPKGGTTYYFAIYAVNDSGKGDKVEVSATVGSQETAAATPPTPTVGTVSYKSLSVTVPAYTGTSPQFGYAPDGATERTGDYTLELYNPTTDSWSDTGKDIASDQATTATLEQLTPGTAYKVRVKAYPKEGGNDVGTNLQTTSAEVDASTKQVTTPGAPQNAQATPVSGEKSVTLSWNAPADDGGQAITGYEVYWSESSGVTSATGTAVTVSGTSTSVTVENLPKGGTTYYFAIYAVNASGKGDKVEVSATVGSQETAAATPPTPTVVASYESLSVTVPAYAGTSPQFGYAPDGATERTGDYTLELYNPTTDSWSDTGKDIASDQATTATLEQLTPGTAYKVRVKAYPKEGGNDVGTNLQTTSAEVDASTKQVTTPGAPQNAQATPVSGEKSVTLSWNAPADDGGQAITGYEVYWSESGGVTSATGTAVTVSGTSTSVTVENLPKGGTTYYFAIYAVNASGKGDKVEVSATVGSQETAAATPPTPTVVASYESLSVTVPAYAGTSPQFGYAPDGATERTGDYTLELYNPTTDSWSDTGKDIASDQATTATLEQLTPGTAYKVRVKAYPKEGGNDVGTNLQTTSAEVDASTKQVTTPGAPQNAQATPVSGEKSVTLSWNAPADDGGQAITGYEVYWSESGGVTSATGTAVTVSGTSTSVTVENLPKGGTTYYFAIYAVNASGKGDKVEVSATVSSQETAAATPPTPTVGTVSYKSLSVTVPAYAGTSPQFGYAPDGATERTGDYTLELYNPTTDSWSDTGKDIASDQATTATLEQLTPGTAYKVRVKAYPKEGGNDVGTNLQTTSAEVDASTKQVTTPGAPQNAQATPVSGKTDIALSWNAPADDGGQAITGYEVYWSESSGVTSATGTAVTVSGTSTSVTVENLPKGGTTYYFAIYAVNDSGKGDKVEVSGQTNAVAPKAPQNVAIDTTKNTFQAITVSWNAPAHNGGSAITGYRVVYSTSADVTISTSTFTDTTGTSATITNLQSNTQYYVKVYAKNTVGYSAGSTEVSSTTLWAVDYKIGRTTGLGSTTTQGNVMNTSTSSRKIKDVINTYLIDSLTDDEVTYVLNNLNTASGYTFEIGVGDRRSNYSGGFSVANNWSGEDKTNLLLTPEISPSVPYAFKLTFSKATGTFKVTDSHSGANNYGSIRYFKVIKAQSP